MKKGFRDYLTKEDLLQEACVRYLSLQYPKLLFFHPPNEGKRTKFERFKAKVLGIRAGASDLIILKANKDFHGTVIELKVGKNNPTLAQKQFMNQASENGYHAKVIYTFDQFKEYIDFYLSRCS